MAAHTRLVLLTGLLLVFSGYGAAITTYDITVDGDAAAVNVSFELYSGGPDKRINYWETTWSMPDNAEILHISDTQGEIEDYEWVSGNTIRFRTNSGPRRTKEVVTIRYTVADVVTERYNGVDLVTLQLSGFKDQRSDVPDEVTQVTVETAERLLSESHSFGFDYDLSSHGATYKGAGPVNLHLAVGDGGTAYDNFVLFGEGDITEADEMYWLVPAVLGFVPETNTYPVIVLPDDEYDNKVDAWSAGQYRTGGLIFLRESTLEKNEMSAIVMHEVVHAFNEHALRWTKKGLPWFDEGIAKYVEYLVKHEKEIRQREIFGETQEWTGRCSGGHGRCVYTLPPRGTPEQLWEFYRQESDMMYTWSPSTAPTPEARVFGYAFSELLVREYVMDNRFDALRSVYTDLRRINTPSSGARDATDTVLDLLDKDFTPCYDDAAPDRGAFEACLADVNAAEPVVPSSATVADETRSITIEPIEQPDLPTGIVERFEAASRGDGYTYLDAILDILYDIGVFTTDVFNNLFKER